MLQTVLLVGELPAGCEEQLASTLWERASDFGAALERLSDVGQAPCKLVLLCEDRPGIWTEPHLKALRRVAPLARFVRLSGSLCEGQGRSGRPASGTWGMPWHRWPLPLGGAASSNSHDFMCSLPATATPDEIVLARFRPSARRGSGQIAICSHTTDTADALAGVCRAAGYETSVSAGDMRPTETEVLAVIWDTFPAQFKNRDCVAGIRTRHGGAPLLALVGFPRPADVLAAEAAGIFRVLAKPFDTGDLLRHLAQLENRA